MNRVIRLSNPPRFLSFAAVGGKEEKQGPLGNNFDLTDKTNMFGQKTFEMSESEMGRCALNIALSKKGLSQKDIDLLIAGDLQNQCVGSSIGLSSFGIPFLGIYGACSTCTEALLITSLFLGENKLKTGACVTTSHNASAERQFRMPLEYGSLRSPTSQWTSTAAGAFVLTSDNNYISKGLCHNVEICDIMAGRVVDGACSDASNMGGAMSFAAAKSILEYFNESGFSPKDFDFIVTGDLGAVGSSILREILSQELPVTEGKHRDCGLLIYDMKKKGVVCGASGCGTSAAVLATFFLKKLDSGEFENILFLSTGALMSPNSVLQGNNIAGIAPVIHLRHVL